MTAPILVYGAFATIWGLATPSGSSVLFLTGVLISKAGTAVAFVGLYVMFILGEIGQAIGPGYTWPEAASGAISETVYVPVSAWITARLVR